VSVLLANGEHQPVVSTTVQYNSRYVAHTVSMATSVDRQQPLHCHHSNYAKPDRPTAATLASAIGRPGFKELEDIGHTGG